MENSTDNTNPSANIESKSLGHTPRLFTPTPTALREKHYELKIKFIALIAIECQNNQNLAEEMLQQNEELRSQLISHQQINITDAAGRQFTQPLSAYQYAFWAGDTRICYMMNKYLDEKTKAAVREQCLNIEKNGIDFIFHEKSVRSSKHFDFTPLIDAYKSYHEVAPENFCERTTETTRRWLMIGKELIKVPTHVAQEYCNLSDMRTYSCSTDSELKRSVIFYNEIIERHQYWFINGKCHPDIGTLFSISPAYIGWPKGSRFCSGKTSRTHLLWVETLKSERTVNDRGQILSNFNAVNTLEQCINIPSFL